MSLPGLRGNEWVVRRSGGRLSSALRLVVAVNLAYAVAWALDALLAWLLVRGPRSDMLSLSVTVPMMLLHVPWIWSWPPVSWSSTPEIRENVATSMRLGLERREASILCIAGLISNALGLVAVGLALVAAFVL